MKKVTIAVALLSTVAFAGPAQSHAAERSAPVAAPLSDATPMPADTPWPGGTITLDIDASDTSRGVYSVTQTFPVAPGTSKLTLLYPEWLPGNHAPRGPINLVSNIRFYANDKPLEWKRNPLDVYQFDIALPQGTSEVTARFVHTSPVTGREGRITMTQEMLNLQWEKMSFYPAGHYTRRIAVKPSVTMPEGWSTFTALDGKAQQGSRVSWAVTDYETLVDSPIFAGKYAQQWEIGENVRLNAVGDAPKYLALAPENLARFGKLVDEADALFGTRQFDHYDFLLAMTDRMGGIGLEHHRSSENQYEPTALIDWEAMDWDHNVVSHELVHSWNGKFRRPAGLWTPDYRTPMQNNLLWLYEGQTQFWGWVLAARSGLQRKDTILGTIALAAANYSEGQPGREWRSVQDTTNDPIINSRRPLPYSSLSRSEDYYVEGALTWLEADQIIRQGTGGKKGLDDFARTFFGKTDGDWGVLTYDFEEIVSTLNEVYPYDWASFLDTRLRQPNQPAPLRGIEMAGYRLVWKEEPNSYSAGRMKGGKYLDLFYSLGINLDPQGKVISTLWDGPAFRAGIVNGSIVVAVNGAAFSPDAIKEAVTAAKGNSAPLELLVRRGDNFATVALDYHGGLRYPWLEAAGSESAGLDRLLEARAK